MKNISALLIVLTLAFSCKGVDVEKYSGDGQIEMLGKGIQNGFRISFGEFDMGNNHFGNYAIKNLPYVNDLYNFGLYVPKEYNHNNNAFLGIKLINSSGEIVFDCKSPLNIWILTDAIKIGDRNFLYAMDQKCSTSVEPQFFIDHNDFNLEINYTSGDVKSDIKAMVVLRVGGYK